MANGERTAKTERRFYNAAGEESARAGADTVRAKITFLGDEGGELEFSHEDFENGVKNAGMWFGFVTSITNAAGGTNPNMTPYERAADRLDTLRSGEWTGEREGGPQIGLVVAAAVKLGYNEDAVRSKLRDGSVTVSQLLKNEAIEAEVLKLREEKLAEKRKAAQAKASAGTAGLKSLLG